MSKLTLSQNRLYLIYHPRALAALNCFLFTVFLSKVLGLALPCLLLSSLALPSFVLPCLGVLYLVLACFALPWLALPCLALTCVDLPCLALPCLGLHGIELGLQRIRNIKYKTRHFDFLVPYRGERTKTKVNVIESGIVKFVPKYHHSGLVFILTLGRSVACFLFFRVPSVWVSFFFTVYLQFELVFFSPCTFSLS